MGVASPHWPQHNNALSQHQICLLSFVLAWSVTVYAGSNDTVHSTLCYIRDTGCDACKKCVNSLKDECACVLLSGKATCDVQCMEGKWNRDRITDWPEVGIILFVSAALVVLGLESFTLWYWWKHGTSVKGPTSPMKSESSEVTTTNTHECAITATTLVVTTAENTIALIDPCCQPGSEDNESETAAVVSVESCVDTGVFVPTSIAETAPERNATSSLGTSSLGTSPEIPPSADVPENA